MNWKIFSIIFIILIAVFVYPSFRLGGVDCLAGCAVSQGLPYAYLVEHGGGVVLPGGYPSEFFLNSLMIDIIIWFASALIITKAASLMLTKRLNYNA